MTNLVWYTQNILICCLLPYSTCESEIKYVEYWQKQKFLHTGIPSGCQLPKILSSLRTNNCFKHRARKKIVRCPKSSNKCKYSAWLSQTEIQSQLYNEKPAMYCITCFLFSFDDGMLLVSQAVICSSWPVLLMVSSIPSLQGALSGSDSVWPWQGPHLCHFSMYNCLYLCQVGRKKPSSSHYVAIFCPRV